MPTDQTQPLTVTAVVEFNSGEAIVLNRPLRLQYKQVGQDFIGEDGPFHDHLYYQQGGGEFVAFAGRELELSMQDGSIRKIKNHWWSGCPKGYTHATVGSVEDLKKCYVFGGANITTEEYVALRATYTGCVYPYRDYEKIIKFDDMRRDLWRSYDHEKKRREALTLAVTRKHLELLAAQCKHLDWLENRGVDFIGFTDGSALDIANSPMGLRAEIDGQIEEEARHAEKVS